MALVDFGAGPKPMHVQGLLYILNHMSKPLQFQIPVDSIMKSVLQCLTSHMDRGPLLDIESVSIMRSRLFP